MSGTEKKESVYFAMNMPEWFVKTEPDEAMRIVEEIADSVSLLPDATQEELDVLMPA